MDLIEEKRWEMGFCTFLTASWHACTLQKKKKSHLQYFIERMWINITLIVTPPQSEWRSSISLFHLVQRTKYELLVIHILTRLFNKYFRGSLYLAGALWGTGDLVINKVDQVSWSWHFGAQVINMYVTQIVCVGGSYLQVVLGWRVTFNQRPERWQEVRQRE